MAASKAFSAAVFLSDTANAPTFESFAGRALRYAMQWAFYEGNQYSNLQSWLQGYKVDGGLYKYIRNIYNPVLRIGDFWTQVVWRGSLSDDAANDGAIPIDVGDQADEILLRDAIAQIQKWSNWNVNKDIHILHGTILGDAVIYIRDDRARKQARLEVLHPSSLVAVELDEMNFVKSYAIEYTRTDNDGKAATYRETCEHGAAGTNEIVFKTFRINKPYAWAGNNDETGSPVDAWSMQCGFVPLVTTQHKNIGLDWGVCEFHASAGKISEINDAASLLNDQIRKTINVKWLANWAKPGKKPTTQSDAPTIDVPQPGREDENMIYVDKDAAKAQALVAPIDIAQTLENIVNMIGELENDLPELKSEVWAGGSGPSDSTILAARGRVEGKVQKRRAGYDTGFVRAVQMAITLAGIAGYDGFSGYNADSFLAGKLEFSVADRPIFPPQPSEILAQEAAFWTGWAPLEGSSIPFDEYARSMGWSEERIDAFMTARDVKILKDKTGMKL